MKFEAIDNPPNPYESRHAEWLEPPPVAKLTLLQETAGSILSKNDSPDLPFRWSVNPYRGCQHGCSYCYARRTHEYLGFGAGTDFDTKIVAKLNAPELLSAAFAKRSWQRECVMFSGVTDCYQPLEASLELTRRCLQVCLDYRNPVAVVTKGFLVVRDADLLSRLNNCASSKVMISIPFLDKRVCKLIEPQAPVPSRRFEAIRRLSDAGVPVGVFISPIIPGLNESDIPGVLQKAVDAGATSASMTALRLPGSVADVFIKRLRKKLPLRADRVLNRLRDIRRGQLNSSGFGERMRGAGPYWDCITRLFEVSRNQVGLGNEHDYTKAAMKSNIHIHKPISPRRDIQTVMEFH